MAHVIPTSGFPAVIIDPVQPTPAPEPAFRFKPDMLAWGAPLLIGVFALVAALVGWAVNPKRFYFAYLIAWVFCLSLTLGSLFFVMSLHSTKAHWAVVVRRIAEALMWSFPLLLVLFIPILFGMHDLYHWTHGPAVVNGQIAVDELAEKRAYLNVPFWLIRMAIYFFVWTLMSYKLYRLSVRQDVDPDVSIPPKQRVVSAWGLPVFALSLCFASYDLIMSVDPHWFSTIFSVYFFGGCYWAAIALVTILTAMMQRSGAALVGVVTKEHYHDLGKWLFAFTIFWSYVAFAQYMLIWYANLPEETIWYRHRLNGGWGWFSIALLVCHFMIPFAVLLPRATKRNIPLMCFMSVWALVMQWIDMFWLIMPVYQNPTATNATLGMQAAGDAAHAGAQALAGTALYGPAYFHWIDFACWIGLFGIYLGAALWRMTRHSIVPRNDPRLDMSLAFQNS
ncbi:MAG TPA: hypothetical protein VFG50_11980 [Rhodothermales bacterium]|nr:hypothetical protein [Rhodothermales bacterium]